VRSGGAAQHRDPEVDELEKVRALLVVLGDHDVGGLQVAVDHPQLVDVLQCRQDVEGHAGHLELADAALGRAVHQLLQAAATQVLEAHAEERPALQAGAVLRPNRAVNEARTRRKPLT
jgi:hypothetical protein